MKLLLENWRKYVNEGSLPRYEELPAEHKAVAYEEIQKALLDASKFGFEPPYPPVKQVIWSAGQQTHSRGTKIFANVNRKLMEHFPEEISPGGHPKYENIHVLMNGVGKEVFELHARIKNIEDEEMRNKIEEMIFSPSGLGWVQALEILRSIG